MLSPCDYHLQVPRDWSGNLRYRLAALQLADGSADNRAAFVAACRDDFLFFVNAFCWQYNPKKKGLVTVGPFTTYPFQEDCARDVLWCIDHDEDLVIEKARELGATWLMIFLIVWLFLFHPWQKLLLVSKDENTVKLRSDPKSLFWKVSFVLDHLPGWMKPADVGQTKNGYVNSDNHSTITGEASVGTAGVADRVSVMFIDEFSLIRDDFELLQGTASTAACRIFNGTHKGIDKAFYHLLYDDGATMRQFRMHWTQHPDKWAGAYRFDAELREIAYLDQTYRHPENYPFVRQALPTGGFAPGVRSPWYDRECAKLRNDTRAIAEEQDIDPRAAKKQVFDGLMIADRIKAYCRRPAWRGHLYADDEGNAITFKRDDDGGPLQLWFDPAAYGWKTPKREGTRVIQYAIGADVSRGTGATPSTATVGNNLGLVVGQYCDRRIEPKKFGRLLVALARWFGDEKDKGAQLAWEIPGPGIEVSEEVIRLGYRHIFWKKKNKGGVYTEQDSDVPGWMNHGGDGADLAIIVADYNWALEQRWCINPSREAMDECLNFKYTRKGVEHQRLKVKNDPSGEGESHGDLTVSACLYWMLIKDLVQDRPQMVFTPPVSPASLEYRRQRAADADRETAYESWD